MACLVCGSAQLAVLYEGVRDHYAVATETYRFLRCRDCGSATLDPLPAPEALAALYSPHYTFRPSDAGASRFRRLLGALEWRVFYRAGYRQRLDLFRRLTGLASGRVLEVGCGSGLFLRYLREAGYDVEGIEPSKPDVDYARERLGLHVTHGALDTVPLAGGRYDAVLMIYVLEHISDPRETLARVAHVLKPGGWVVLGLPVMDSGQARLLGRRWSAVTEAPRHVMIPSFAGAHALLAAAGFRDVRAAPSPLLENAGHVALSLLPAAATPKAYAGSPAWATLARRAAGALAMGPGLLLAWIERLPGGPGARAGTMFFCART